MPRKVRGAWQVLSTTVITAVTLLSIDTSLHLTLQFIRRLEGETMLGEEGEGGRERRRKEERKIHWMPTDNSRYPWFDTWSLGEEALSPAVSQIPTPSYVKRYKQNKSHSQSTKF